MSLGNAIVIIALALLPQSAPGPAGKEPKWKQIVILQSTRADVERLMGPSDTPGYLITYPLKEGSITIGLNTQEGCHPHREGFWNVPEWTVEEITYTPSEAPPKFKSLNLDLTRFRKEPAGPHTPDIISYIDDEEGVSYTVDPDGTLHDIKYFPSSRYDHLRCDKQ